MRPVPTPSLLHVYVADTDAVAERAVQAGAVVVSEPTDFLAGDKVERIGRLRDPLGNVWWIQTRVAELTPEEVAERVDDTSTAKAMEYLDATLPSALG